MQRLFNRIKEVLWGVSKCNKQWVGTCLYPLEQIWRDFYVGIFVGADLGCPDEHPGSI